MVDIETPPGITLLSSPNPEQFVAALQYVLVFMSAQADKPAEREFLGRERRVVVRARRVVGWGLLSSL